MGATIGTNVRSDINFFSAFYAVKQYHVIFYQHDWYSLLLLAALVYCFTRLILFLFHFLLFLDIHKILVCIIDNINRFRDLHLKDRIRQTFLRCNTFHVE